MTKRLRQIAVTLENLGSIVEDLHYGPYSRFWWNFSEETIFPIRLGQRSKAFINECNFYTTVQIEENSLKSQFHCQCEEFNATATNSTKAVSDVYKQMFHNNTRYSGHCVMGWNHNDIQNILRKVIVVFLLFLW